MIKNNKGYLLVEIVLASVLAFGFAYFLLDLTVKLKNKNDDLLVETLTMTDQAIIMNGLMKYSSQERDEFLCGPNNLFKDNRSILHRVIRDNNEIVYNIDISNKYVDIEEIECENKIVNGEGDITIKIPLRVLQMRNKDFTVDFKYHYKVLYGDVNGDGQVNSMDTVHIQRHIANDPGYHLVDRARIRADLNVDNIIDQYDVNILQRHILGWPDYKKLPVPGVHPEN